MVVEIWGRVRAALVLFITTLVVLAPATSGAAVLQLSENSEYGITEVAAIEFAFRELINEE